MILSTSSLISTEVQRFQPLRVFRATILYLSSLCDSINHIFDFNQCSEFLPLRVFRAIINKTFNFSNWKVRVSASIKPLRFHQPNFWFPLKPRTPAITSLRASINQGADFQPEFRAPPANKSLSHYLSNLWRSPECFQESSVFIFLQLVTTQQAFTLHLILNSSPPSSFKYSFPHPDIIGYLITGHEEVNLIDHSYQHQLLNHQLPSHQHSSHPTNPGYLRLSQTISGYLRQSQAVRHCRRRASAPNPFRTDHICVHLLSALPIDMQWVSARAPPASYLFFFKRASNIKIAF